MVHLITIVVNASQVEEVRALLTGRDTLDRIIELIERPGRGFRGATVKLARTGRVDRSRGDNFLLKLIIIVRAFFK